MTRIQPVTVLIHRVEGTIEQLGKWRFQGADCWEATERKLLELRFTAPARGGYDKSLVLITFGLDASGTAYHYSTRFDLQHPDASGYGLTLARHVTQEWEFKALRWTPPHMDPAKHARFLAEFGIDPRVWARRCDTYEIPGMAALCSQCEANAKWNEASGCPGLAEECRRYCRNGHKESPL